MRKFLVASRSLVREVVADIKAGNCCYVMSVPGGVPLKPYELWIDRLGLWVGADGKFIHVAHCRDADQTTALDHDGGMYYPTCWSAWRIRRAFKRWSRYHV